MMKETMGEVIRKLRKERNLTQEELAEQLGVTFQAISKWENNSGMPDISQVIPLANVFGVSTDVLFGIQGTNNAEEVNRIIHHAYSKLTYPSTRECVRLWYDELHKGLEKYPNNTKLLSSCLEAGISLAYPENDVFDPENGRAIYEACIREANIVIKYGQNTTDILRAHMIMVLLHSSYGNFELAKAHAEEFPWRADMTVHIMRTYIAHFQKDYAAENKHYQNDFMYHLEAMLDDLVGMGCCHYFLGDYPKAEYAFMQGLAIIDVICKDEDVVPRFHVRERGDIYSMLADVYLKQDRIDEALSMLEKMTVYDTEEVSKYTSGKRMNTPLLCDADHNFYWTSENYFKEHLLRKLDSHAFDALRENDRFMALMKRATEA